ncbi:MAG: NYN domain-containing protein [Patescibacteria group bacterium]
MKQQLNKKSHPLKHPEQRVGVFIDVQNMYYSAKNLFGAKVNFGNIVKEATAGRKLIRAIAYVVRTETKEEQPFFDALYNLGIETKERPLQIFYGGEKKADWDVGITVDAIRLSPSIDTVVLISGDGDYLPLVDYLRNQGKQVEVMAFGDTTSSKLKEEVDDFIDLSEDKPKFLILNNNKRYKK